VGFFAFWAVTAASSALTFFFQRTSKEINAEPPPHPIPLPLPKGRRRG
jgi:hypothetical protein